MPEKKTDQTHPAIKPKKKVFIPEEARAHKPQKYKKGKPMSSPAWYVHCRKIEDYIEDLFAPEDEILQKIVTSAEEAGMKNIAISATTGKLLQLMAQIIDAKHILEIGTLAGYSTVWLARGMAQGGTLWTVEKDEDAAKLAATHMGLAGLSSDVDIKQAEAANVMQEFIEQKTQMDLVFLDGDNKSYPEMLPLAISLLRRGGLLIADNVIRGGAVLPDTPEKSKSHAMAQFNDDLAMHPELDSVIIQQFGIKGHDGLAIARKKSS